MTFDILTSPANSPASLLFQQCLAEIVPENKDLNQIKDEIGGYFLERAEPMPLSNDLWMKTINSTAMKNIKKTKIEIDPFLSRLPRTLQAQLKEKN
jgi:hypothetical protein